MKRSTLANLMLAIGAATPLMVTNARKQGGANCPYCTLGNMDYQEMKDLMDMCDYHFDRDVSMNEVLSPDFSLLKGEGSFNTESKAMNSIEQASSALTQKEKQDYIRLVNSFPKKYPELATELYNIISKLMPYQLKLLHNMGFCRNEASYLFTKSMVNMSQAIGARNFMNRYLQRTALVVPNSVVVTPLFQRKDAWLTDWICKNRKKNLNGLVDQWERIVNRYGLDFSRDRVFYVFDKNRDRFTTEPLTALDSLRKLAEVAWFIEVAKQVGVTSGSDMLYTYPVENIFTEKRFSSEIGDTVFSRVKYKLHIPTGSQGYPDTKESFLTRNYATYESEIVEDARVDQPYLYIYQKRDDEKPCSIVYYSYTSGSGSIVRTPIFTHTTKMNAPSFSIPAGMPQYGGSCISASYEATGPNKNNTICRGCYALKGNYLYVGYVYAAAPRMNWLVDTLQSDTTGERMACYMSFAIESYARYGRSSTRQELEFGFIKDSSLVFPSGREKTSVFAESKMRIPGRTSQDWIDFTKEGKVAGYFRIHDSGDFTISSNQDTNRKYINSWGMVASTFKQVLFWAPTRNWTLGYKDLGDTIALNDKVLQASFADIQQGIGKQVFQKLGLGGVVTEAKQIWTTYVHWLNQACAQNDNLIIRPSGLTVINPFNRGFIKIPVISSLTSTMTSIAAGTGVNATFAKASSPRFVFTGKAFDTIAFEEAFPPGTQGRLQIKEKIGAYLKSYFENQYKTKSIPKVCYTKAESMDGQEVWQCPVNRKTDDAGKPLQSADSCLGSNCRMCWIQKTKPVTYGAH
jgi:hypothetical protein